VPWLYQTLPMLIFAYVIRFLPQSVGSIRANMLQISPRLEEAARGLGKRRFETFARITLPLLAPGMLAGAALVFLTTIKELPVTLLLSPAGFDTLVLDVWSSASEGLFSQASPPALLIILVSGLSIALILRQERRGGYGSR
jgi:iron(III) transport system permease protein